MAPLLPHPPDHAQRLRTWGLLRQLAVEHDVHLLTWTDDPTSPSVDEVKRAFAGVAVLPLGEPVQTIAGRLSRRLRFLVGGPPGYIAAHLEERDLADDASAGRRAITEVLYRWTSAGGPFDVVIYEDEGIAAVDVGIDAPVIMHRLNLLADTIGSLKGGGVVERVARRIEMPAWRRFDRTVHRHVDAVMATTDVSAARLAEIDPSARIHIASSGVDLEALPDPPSAGKVAGYIGWMSYAPNVDAVTFGVDEVWGRVTAAVADARLRIIGREPTEAVTKLAGPTVEVTGPVGDLRDACAGLRVGFVPLRSGFGIKTKTLEMMAMGRAVVATPRGAEGIGATEADGLIVGTSPAELADAVVDLMTDDARADELGAAARRYVMDHFSWDAIGRRYRADVADVVASAEGRRSN